MEDQEPYDVIMGDLADPVDGGPCYKLYTETFYRDIVKARLNEGGIFVTQVSPPTCIASWSLHPPQCVFGLFIELHVCTPGWPSWYSVSIRGLHPNLQYIEASVQM